MRLEVGTEQCVDFTASVVYSFQPVDLRVCVCVGSVWGCVGGGGVCAVWGCGV